MQVQSRQFHLRGVWKNVTRLIFFVRFIHSKLYKFVCLTTHNGIKTWITGGLKSKKSEFLLKHPFLSEIHISFEMPICWDCNVNRKKSSSFINVTHSIFYIHCVLKFSKLNCDNRFLLFRSWSVIYVTYVNVFVADCLFFVLRRTRNFVETFYLFKTEGTPNIN